MANAEASGGCWGSRDEHIRHKAQPAWERVAVAAGSVGRHTKRREASGGGGVDIEQWIGSEC